MMTLMALAQKYLSKGSESDGDRWMSERQVQLDQVVRFFETEWDGEKGLRWTVNHDKVLELDDARAAYCNCVDKIRHINERIDALVEELLALRCEATDGRHLNSAKEKKDLGVRVAEIKCDLSEQRNRRRQRTLHLQKLHSQIVPLITAAKLENLGSSSPNSKIESTVDEGAAFASAARARGSSNNGLRRRRTTPYTDSELSAILRAS